MKPNIMVFKKMVNIMFLYFILFFYQTTFKINKPNYHTKFPYPYRRTVHFRITNYTAT